MNSLKQWLTDAFEKVELTAENLHDYQGVGVKFCYDTPFCALFIDTGLGKTGIVLNALSRLWLEDVISREEPCLIVAPLRVANVTWPDEIRKWSFSAGISFKVLRDDEVRDAVNKAGQAERRRQKLAGIDIAQLKKEGRTKLVKKYQMMIDTARLEEGKRQHRRIMREDPACIQIIDIGTLEFLCDCWGKDWPFRTVILDESSGFKDHRTKRWKALFRVRPLMDSMIQMTATPAAETYAHLFGQIVLLDLGERFGLDYNRFLAKYFNVDKYTHKITLLPGAEKELTQLIAPLCMVMKQEDYLDLQQPVSSMRKVHLSQPQMEKYNRLERDLVLELEEGEVIEVETAAALSQKLLQMASGVLYQTVMTPDGFEDGQEVFKRTRVVHEIHDEKLLALKDLREELAGEHMLVAYYHQSSLDRILKFFPDARVMDKEGKMIGQWNAGKIPMLLLHPQSGAHGLNLQKNRAGRGRHVVFYDHPWSYELYYQFYRRLARQGQELLVVIHHLVAVGTLEEVQVECLQNKGDAQEYLFKLITRLRRALSKKRREIVDVDL